MRTPNKRPSLFKQRDLARAIRGARAAGATKAHVEIGKDGTISMDLHLGGKEAETTDDKNEWDDDGKAPTEIR
jgi:hypothetical protein